MKEKKVNLGYVFVLIVVVIASVVGTYFVVSNASDKMIQCAYDDVSNQQYEQTEPESTTQIESTSKSSVKSDDKTTANKPADKEESDIKETPEKAEEQLAEKNVSYDKDGTLIYYIQKGDTLSAISKKFGYSVDELAKYNKIQNVNKIYADSSMRIPQE